MSDLLVVGCDAILWLRWWGWWSSFGYIRASEELWWHGSVGAHDGVVLGSGSWSGWCISSHLSDLVGESVHNDIYITI